MHQRVVPPPPTKKVVLQRKDVGRKPRTLPPMESIRPVTPRNEARDNAVGQSTSLHNVSVSRLPGLSEMGVSPLLAVNQLFISAVTPEDFENAVDAFLETARQLHDTTGVDRDDISTYNDFYQILLSISERASAEILFKIFVALRYMVSNVVTSKKTAIIPKITTPNVKKSPRPAKLGPLKPATPPGSAETDERPANKPTEHFYQFMAKLILKISMDPKNDQYFLQPELPEFLISMTSDEHKPDTRIYTATAIKNATNSEKFRDLIADAPNFQNLLLLFNYDGKKTDRALIQISGIIRNMLVDNKNLAPLAKLGIHLVLLNAVSKCPESQDLVYNTFRVLTKMTQYDDIRGQIIEQFTAVGLVTLLLRLLQIHKSVPKNISRICYVLADFAAQEDEILTVAPTISENVDLAVITDLLQSEPVMGDKEAAVLVLQCIANFSVDPKGAEILSLSEDIPPLFKGHTFTSDDRSGLNLLCIAANFTFHDSRYCPTEIIEALPIAIVSKSLPSITEALRILCNLALSPNTQLIDSQIPELLVILLGHPSPEVVCYALQTLTNLVTHGGVRRRFRTAGGVDAVSEILDADEIDEAVADSACKLLMNFGALSADEANAILAKVELFDQSSLEVLPLFKEYLRKQTLVSV